MKLKRCDMHVHTSASLDFEDYTGIGFNFRPLGSPEEVYYAAKRAGMDFVTFTDHNSIAGCLELIKKRGPLDDFFISEEVSVDHPDSDIKLEVNVFNINEKQHEKIQELRKDFQKLMRYLEKEKIIHSYNHPFWHPHGTHKVDDKKIHEMAKKFRIIEARNGNFLRRQNLDSMKLARKLRKGKIGGSDTHTCDPGRTYTTAEGKNLAEFLKNIEKKKSFVRGKHMTRQLWYRTAKTIIQQTIKSRFYGLLGLPIINRITNLIVYPIWSILLHRYLKHQNFKE